MVLPSITFDHTPLVSSYHPSFQFVPITDSGGAAGAAVCCEVPAGAGASRGWEGGEVAQPLMRAVIISSPIHIHMIYLIPGTVISTGK
jgi:hypothetical protein